MQISATIILLMGGAVLASGDGFVSLFDGKTTDGWLEITGAAFPGSWMIEDGSLKAVPGLTGFQDIRTRAEFEDFELEFSWRISAGGNSGVKYRLDKVDRWPVRGGGPGYHARARGPEYQIVDDHLNADAQASAKNTAGGLYGKIAPVVAAANPAGEWNLSRILVRGAHLEHWLNGQKVVECECAGPRHPSPIALQNHDSAVWFRSLRIRKL